MIFLLQPVNIVDYTDLNLKLPSVPQINPFGHGVQFFLVLLISTANILLRISHLHLGFSW